MTDREALRIALAKAFVAVGKIECGIRENTYSKALKALFAVLPAAKDALDFLCDCLDEDEVESARKEAEALE